METTEHGDSSMSDDRRGLRVEHRERHEDTVLMSLEDRPRLDGSADEDPDDLSGAPPRGHRRLRRTLLVLGTLVLVLAVVVVGGFWYVTNRYAGNIDRVGDVFAGIDEGARPAAPS